MFSVVSETDTQNGHFITDIWYGSIESGWQMQEKDNILEQAR